jgi:hypothetical protein
MPSALTPARACSSADRGAPITTRLHRICIVTIEFPAAFRAHPDAIDGARLVSELPPGRVARVTW